MKRKRVERIVQSRKYSGLLGESKKSLVKKSLTQSLRRIRTSDGNSIFVMPGVRPSQVAALMPSRWTNKEIMYGSGRFRKGHGLVFSATSTDAKGKKIYIQCRAIRSHYTTTHESRMLMHLRSLGFQTEQPLGILITPEKERMIIVKRVSGGEERRNKSLVRATKNKLNKLGIVPEDFDQYGKPNYLIKKDKNGKEQLVLIDVEHYHVKDPKSRLHISRASNGLPSR